MRYVLLLIAAIFLASTSLQASPWTEGEKTVLYIRADFSDLPGEPVSEEYLKQALGETHDFYFENSSGKTSLKFTVTPTLRMPQTATWYGNIMDSPDIIGHARTAAKAAGFDTAQYDLEIVAFKTHKGDHGGVGAVNGKGLRLKNNFNSAVTVHELGHNFGLPHAKYWKTNDGTIIGDGQEVDFGDPHDWMGGGGGHLENHLSVPLKYKLNWINDRVEDVKTSGIYRIYAHDMPGAPGLRGLKINRNSKHIYWVEFRQRIEESVPLMNGARILWSYKANNEVDVLDMTPDSPHGAHDAALLVGRTFSDEAAGVHITPTKKGGTQPESLDVAVHIGKFPENRPPVLDIKASTTTVTPGQEVEFKAQATDADGDDIAYYWDFGDGSAWGGSALASHAWNGAPAKYIVRCTASDMKGGTANRSIIVNLGNLDTAEIKGRVTMNGKPLQDVRVGIGGKDYILTDSDGSYTLVNLDRRRYEVRARKAGHIIEPAGSERGTVSGPDSHFDLVAFLDEAIPPTATTNLFDTHEALGSLPELSGGATDNENGSGVHRVTVVIQRENDGAFWTGTNWLPVFAEVEATLEGNKWTLTRGLPQRGALSSGNYIVTPIAYDRSGNASLEVPQRAGNAMIFDGRNDAIEIAEIAGLPGGNKPFSIEAWVNLASKPEYRAWLVMLGAQGTGAMHWWYDENGLLDAGAWGARIGQGQLGIKLPINEWAHIANTFDGTSLKAYVNGKPAGSTNATFNIQGTHFMIAKQAPEFVSWNRFQGAVDEVRVWNIALTQQQINDNLYRSLTNRTPGLILCWNLDEAKSLTAADASGNSNNGTITDKSSWLLANSIRVTIR